MSKFKGRADNAEAEEKKRRSSGGSPLLRANLINRLSAARANYEKKSGSPSSSSIVPTTSSPHASNISTNDNFSPSGHRTIEDGNALFTHVRQNVQASPGLRRRRISGDIQTVASSPQASLTSSEGNTPFRATGPSQSCSAGKTVQQAFEEYRMETNQSLKGLESKITKLESLLTTVVARLQTNNNPNSSSS